MSALDTTHDDTASAAKPAALEDILPMLQGRESEPSAKKLLEDIPKLQEWQRADHPSHTIRDAMCKLGSRWGVARKLRGQKRQPAEVAQDLTEKMLQKAKRIC